MSERPKTTFVLSGGAAPGAIQVGMLRALYERGIEPDLIIGTSVGALNGAYIASRPFVEQTADELAEVWGEESAAGRSSRSTRSPASSGFSAPAGTSYPTERCASCWPSTSSSTGSSRRQGPLPRYRHRRPQRQGGPTLGRGGARGGARERRNPGGSSPPVEWGHRRLIDGGVSNNAPISHALELGAERVYVLPTGTACDLEEPPRGALGMLLHSMSLLVMGRLQVEVELLRDRAVLIVLPPPCPLSGFADRLSRSEELIRRGLEGSRDHLARLDSGQARITAAAPVDLAPVPAVPMRSARRAPRCSEASLQSVNGRRNRSREGGDRHELPSWSRAGPWSC